MDDDSSSSAFGIAAALVAPLIMTIGFLLWDDHWKGSAFALNLFKCSLASIGFLVLSLTVPLYVREREVDDDTERDGASGIFPPDVFTRKAVGFLFLSSTIGIVIGDWTWLQALQLLGARRVILMDSLKPFLAAVFGWLLLDEKLGYAVFAGIFLTMLGIVVASMEQAGTEKAVLNERTSSTKDQSIKSTRSCEDANEDSHDSPEEGDNLGDDEIKHEEHEESSPTQQWNVPVGFFLSALNVVLDTYGSVLTKQHGQHMTVWEINLCRFGFAAIVLISISCMLRLKELLQQSCRGRCEGPQRAARTTTPWYGLPVMQRRAWMAVAGGVLFVTFLTPALSNYALFQIALALAITLGSAAPLYELLLSSILRREWPSMQACGGAVLAVAGVVVLIVGGTYMV